MNDGFWITKVTWSPDGTQIAFDVSPQSILNGRYSLLGNVTQSQIHVVNANPGNPNPHQLFAGIGAAYPSWGIELAPQSRPTLQISRNGSGLRIRMDGLPAGQAFRLQGSTDLQNWGALLNTQSTGNGHLIDVAPNPQVPFASYRVVVP